MGVLEGDVNGSGRVDSGDVSLVRQQTLQTITNSNFKEDINASGASIRETFPLPGNRP